MTLFFYGPNTYAIRHQVDEMIAAYRAKAETDFGLERIDGSSIKPHELQASLQASPFLAASRLVVVQGLGTSKLMGDKLEEILANVPESTVAVFAEREIDQRTIVFKALEKADRVVKFEMLSAPQLIAWCQREVKRLDGTIDRAALAELLRLAGEDQWRLASELTKLVNYNDTITAETVRELVSPTMDETIFGLVEAMSAGRAKEALGQYHSLLRQKQSEIYILTMIQWQLRNLLLAKTSPGLNQAELAKAASMSPYVASKMLAAARNLSEATLADGFRAAADCEYNIKSGRLKGQAAVEQLIFQVSALTST